MIFFLISSVLNATTFAENKIILIKFLFEQKNTSDDSLNITYGGNDEERYSDTSGIFFVQNEYYIKK